MLIAIPVNDKNLESDVCLSFGRAPYFLIYDTKSGESEYVANKAASVTSGAGIKAAQIVADNKAEALLTPRCGQNAADVISAAGIRIYKTKNASVKSNIAAFIEGKLVLLDDFHAGLHKRGGR